MNDVDIFLQHYGVRGMKWGVRTRRSRPDNIPSQFMLRKEEKQKRLEKGQEKVANLFDTSSDMQNRSHAATVRTIISGKNFSTNVFKGALFKVTALSLYTHKLESDEETILETGDDNE